MDNLKPGDKVIVHSPDHFEDLEKEFERYAMTRAGRGFESEKTIVLKNCSTRFSLRGRGVGTAKDKRKWITVIEGDRCAVNNDCKLYRK